MMVYKCLRIVDEVVVIDPGVATLMSQKKDDERTRRSGCNSSSVIETIHFNSRELKPQFYF